MSGIRICIPQSMSVAHKKDNVASCYRADAVCAHLYARLQREKIVARVDSVFPRAINFFSAGEMFSVLTADRGLRPNAICLCANAPIRLCGSLLQPGMKTVFCRRGVFVEERRLCGSLTFFTRREDLSVRRIRVNRALLPRQAGILKGVLASLPDSDGLSCLATGSGTNLYADFLRPRVKRFQTALKSGDPALAAAAASQMAGCGVGLTPSSDDLLCGYFLAWQILTQKGGERAYLDGLQAMAEKAAEKTNRISGAFLLQSARGYAAEEVLCLLERLFGGAEEASLKKAARRVLDIGATSGGDILTGVCLALQYEDGGNWRDTYRDTKECLL